ncbi:MAG: DinB family protein [Saprospiraceae bacterium]
MNNISSPQNKSEIQQSLTTAASNLENYLLEQSLDDFSKSYQGKWSAAEHLGHLILSAFPVASALKQDKSIFANFGIAENGSHSFDELYEAYKGRLAVGQKADAKRIPSESDIKTREEMIATIKVIFSKIYERLKAWEEAELDQYRVPHPALGLITFRELLFFTSFHTSHHLEILKSRDISIT